MLILKNKKRSQSQKLVETPLWQMKKKTKTHPKYRQILQNVGNATVKLDLFRMLANVVTFTVQSIVTLKPTTVPSIIINCKRTSSKKIIPWSNTRRWRRCSEHNYEPLPMLYDDMQMMVKYCCLFLLRCEPEWCLSWIADCYRAKVNYWQRTPHKA